MRKSKNKNKVFINAFAISDENERIITRRTLKENYELLHLDVLHISKDENGESNKHYTYITDFDRLMSNSKKHKEKNISAKGV